MTVSASATCTHRVEAEQHQEWDGGEAAPLPLLQRDGAVRIVVDLHHHVLQDLQQSSVALMLLRAMTSHILHTHKV